MGNTPDVTPSEPPVSSTATERSMVSNPPGTAPVGTDAPEAPATPPAEAPQEPATPAAPETPASDQPGTETEATTDEEAAAAAATAEEPQPPTGYDQLLPYETAAAYPLELLALAAKKFGVDPEGLEGNKPLLDLLTSKVSGDIIIRNSKYDAELAAADADAGTEATPEDGTAPDSSTPSGADVDAQTEKTFSTAMQLAKVQVSPKLAKLYGDSLNKVQTALDDAYKSKDQGKIDAAVHSLAETQAAFVNLGVNDMLSRALPQMMRSEIEAYVSGREEETSTYSKARGLVFQDPKLGSDAKKFHESGQFEALTASDRHPEILAKQFVDADGKPLGPVQNAVAQYRYATVVLRGETMESPQSLATATEAGMEAGRKSSAEVAQRANAGAFGNGGRSTGKLGTGAEESDDDFMKNLVNANARKNPMRTIAFSRQT